MVSVSTNVHLLRFLIHPINVNNVLLSIPIVNLVVELVALFVRAIIRWSMGRVLWLVPVGRIWLINNVMLVLLFVWFVVDLVVVVNVSILRVLFCIMDSVRLHVLR